MGHLKSCWVAVLMTWNKLNYKWGHVLKRGMNNSKRHPRPWKCLQLQQQPKRRSERVGGRGSFLSVFCVWIFLVLFLFWFSWLIGFLFVSFRSAVWILVSWILHILINHFNTDVDFQLKVSQISVKYSQELSCFLLVSEAGSTGEGGQMLPIIKYAKERIGSCQF